MKALLRFIFLFFVFLFLQVFLARNLEIGMGAHLFLLPLFVMLLPFETNVFVLMGLGFMMGIIADSIMNTYGLNASSLVLFAYLRPFVFKSFTPKEGYDALKNPTLSEMGWTWFLFSYGALLLMYVFWYFLVEIFSFREFLLILRNSFFIFIFSMIVALILQLFFRKKTLS
jgi:hypothetical protein